MKTLFMAMILLLSGVSFAGSKVAVVKLLRGEVRAVMKDKSVKLKLQDWVEEGAVIKTEEKSFVKLVFVDKSQMNVGPKSQMTIEKFTGKDSGVIDLVKGKIRSQVTKDYLQIQDKNKSKLFIKTKNAVMGVRGTDFLISTNGKTTSTILFEGEVVFNRLDSPIVQSTKQLEDIVDRGVRIYPGEFSVVDNGPRKLPTVPALINVQQKEKLENNTEFQTDRAPSNTEGEAKAKSIVPEGLDGKVVANAPDALKENIGNVVGTVSVANTDPDVKKGPATVTLNEPKANPSGDRGKAEGFVDGEKVKPANGSFVHVDSGVIIPPDPNSVLDPNTNTFIPTGDAGRVSPTGDYVPPKNVQITNDGKVFVAVNEGGKSRMQEIEKPLPVVKDENVALGKVAETMKNNPRVRTEREPAKNDILNSEFVPAGATDLSNDRLNKSGGFTGSSDPARQLKKVETTIIVNPNGQSNGY